MQILVFYYDGNENCVKIMPLSDREAAASSTNPEDFGLPANCDINLVVTGFRGDKIYIRGEEIVL
jgi:hypothetical protein